ncbi:hypothetical protein MMC28_006577 [Mycoblastus sanguinarius]|nr:hypothetical protein [Mycoblastus sanguinarius]
MQRYHLHNRAYEKESHNVAQTAWLDLVRHRVCVAGGSEDRAYHDSIHGYQGAASTDSPEYYSVTCEGRHSGCGTIYNGGDCWLITTKAEGDLIKMDLSILHVCRQMYKEATHLLWTTNIFSFDEEVTFQRFMESLSPMQKAKLAKLHIRENYGDGTIRLWKKVMRLSLVNSLSGLRTLHLSLDQDVSPGSQLLQQFHVIPPEDLTEPLLLLRLLQLKHVTVVVSDNRNILIPPGNNYWTFSEKRAVAQRLRNKLLNPTEAELSVSEGNARQGDREYDTDCQRTACQNEIFQLCQQK